MTQTIVFAGDSITDAGRRTDPEGIGDGYARLIRDRWAGAGRRVVNAGVSGDRVRDLRRRWAHDVMSAAPDMLSVFVGVNDTWRRFDSDDETTAEQFEADYRWLLDEARQGAVRRLVLVEPFVLPVADHQREWLDDLAGKQRVVEALAAEYDATLVRVQAPLLEAAAGDPARLAPDGVHPSEEGSRLLAELWMSAVG